MLQSCSKELCVDWNSVKILGSTSPAQLEWKRLQAEVKSCETNCNNIKSQITVEKEKQDRESKILKWLSPHDIRGSFKSVLERTGVDDQYSARCQWLVDHENFEKWYAPGTSSVLWLNGTIGTGKTTVMARAINEMQKSQMIEIDAMPLAIFFFQKALGPSASLLSVVTCLRSLIRQLSWNNTTAQVDLEAEKKYTECQNQHSDDSSLSLGECRSLLKHLVSERETYIMIDAIDECENPNELLSELKRLTLPMSKDMTDSNLCILCYAEGLTSPYWKTLANASQ